MNNKKEVTESELQNLYDHFHGIYPGHEIIEKQIDDVIFIYRDLKKSEYDEIYSRYGEDEFDFKNVILENAILYPLDIDISSMLASTFNDLYNCIIKDSFFDSIESLESLHSFCRSTMSDLFEQFYCIINEAFPYMEIDKIRNCTVINIYKMLTKAEWKLKNLRGVKIEEDIYDKIKASRSNRSSSEVREYDNKSCCDLTDEEKEDAMKDFSVESNLPPTNNDKPLNTVEFDTTPPGLRTKYANEPIIYDVDEFRKR